MNLNFILIVPVLLFSIVLHEVAHGWVALRQGDDTAEQKGRITLNPIPHIDLFGTILFPIMLVALRAPFLFGWAKPVPVDPRKFRNYRRGDIAVSLAGIAANLLLALVFLILILILGALRQTIGENGILGLLVAMAAYGVIINLVLAVFNAIPIPPLDGSHVVYHALPPRIGAMYRQFGRFGPILIFAILFLVPGAQAAIFGVFDYIIRVMEPLVLWAT